MWLQRGPQDQEEESWKTEEQIFVIFKKMTGRQWTWVSMNPAIMEEHPKETFNMELNIYLSSTSSPGKVLFSYPC